jgi:hypothetical protein
LKTESKENRAFLIVTDQVMPKSDNVLKQNGQVLKPQVKATLDSRLSVIESQIA